MRSIVMTYIEDLAEQHRVCGLGDVSGVYTVVVRIVEIGFLWRSIQSQSTEIRNEKRKKSNGEKKEE